MYFVTPFAVVLAEREGRIVIPVEIECQASWQHGICTMLREEQLCNGVV